MPDGANHVAFAYSAGGKDRFMTVYPNLNLLDGTDFKNFTPKVEEHLSVTVKTGGVLNKPYISASYNNPEPNSWSDVISWFLDKEHFKPSTTYTFSFYVRGKGTIRTHIYPSLIDTSANGLADGKAIRPAPDGAYDWNLTNEWVRHTYTFTSKSSITEGQYVLFRLFTGNSADICLPKLEEGPIATPWMPSFSEVTAEDYPSYIGTYTDNDSNTQSTDPGKYTWKKIVE